MNYCFLKGNQYRFCMDWGNITTVAIAVSMASTFVRWRLPTVHPAIASAGLGASICAAILSFIQPPFILAASITLNFGLVAAVIDLLFVSKLKPARTEEAQGATLRLTFHGDDRHPTAIKCQNVGSWCAYYSPSIHLAGQAEDGVLSTFAVTPKAWAIFIAYDLPTEVTQIVASLNASGLPAYNVLLSTKRACVVSFSSDIPAGDLEIDVRTT